MWVAQAGRIGNPMVKPANLAVLLTAAVSIAGAAAGVSSSSAASGPEIVARQSAMNRAAARRDAERRLGMISLPPGAVPSPTRPSGIGRRLTGPAAIPGGVRQVSEHRFWTVPGPPRRVYRWLHHHPPPGTSENYGHLVFWNHGPPGTLGATGVIAAVERTVGGTAVRADVFDGWELPRDPTERIPAGARFLSLEVGPASGGLHAEGEEVPPVRRISTERAPLISALVRLVNRQPAFQLFDLPSCGPEGPASEYRSIVFRFRDRRHGRLLADVSQETPIVLCDPLTLRLPGHKPYPLERGWSLIRRAHDLIRRARPVSTAPPRHRAPLGPDSPLLVAPRCR